MIVHGPYPVGEPRVAREARAARAAGWEVDVVATRRPGEPTDELVDGLTVVRLPVVHKRGGGAARLMSEYLRFVALASVEVARRSRRSRYRVVQVHNPPDFLVAAALLLKLRGARIVLDVHDLSADMFAMRFGGQRWARLLERGLRLVERGAAAVADAVVTVHEPYRRELAAHGVPPDKITVVMNSLDEALLPQEPRGPVGEAFRVVYHGTVTPHYGVDLLLDAFASISVELPHATLEILGAGDSVPELRRRLADAGLEDRVVLSGEYLPHAEVLRRVAGAGVGVVPNRPTRLNQFALSSKLFEYVALRVPAVVADLPTLAEHFSGEEVRFFLAGDPDALADALREVAADPERAGLRANAARRRYEAYRWPVQARRYVELLDSLVRGEAR
jgi:glycosyltransferase involved in cell wall biosynthesis